MRDLVVKVEENVSYRRNKGRHICAVTCGIDPPLQGFFPLLEKPVLVFTEKYCLSA